MADDMMEAEMENSESSLAIEIMAGRKSDNTKNQCKHKVEHFKKWLQSRHPVCIEESGSTDLSAVDRKILKEFLGHICKKKDDEGVYCDPVVFLSYQHVSGYKSAIKDYFITQEVKISDEIERMFTQFFEGYKRTVAKLKQDGVMPILEGKCSLGSSFGLSGLLLRKRVF